VVRIVPPFRRN
jgi:hypothetical protein